MGRLRRFADNAGVQVLVQTGVVLLILVFAVWRDLQVGYWMYTVPVLLVALGASYFVRSLLVDNFRVVRIVMNVALVAAIIVLLVVGGLWGLKPLWLRLAVAAFVGLYLGCYFWLLSDDRITIESR